MTQKPDKTPSPVVQFIQASSWLGVGIWTLTFAVTYLQLWLYQ